MVYDVISAKEALAISQEARKHYREGERLALLKYVDAEIKVACEAGELSVAVGVAEEDLNFLVSFLKEKGYNVEENLDKPITIEICWD